MFGAFQAGVWAELEPLVKPAIVIGASVGSLNGWAIAGGISGDQLIAEWLDPAREAPPRYRWPPTISDGIIDSTALEFWIRELHARWTPRLRFGVALTRRWSLELEVVEHPHVSWQHLAASCGVPLFLKQYTIDGVPYTDGGLVAALPRWAAIRMGARCAITVNALAHRCDWPAVAGARLLRRWSGFRDQPPPEFRAIALDPLGPLGAAGEMIRWRRDRVAEWIDQGRAAVRRNKHFLCDMF